MSRTIAIAAAACLVLGAGTAATEGVPAAQPQSADSQRFSNADELLTALETADRGLRRLSADVEYTKVFQPDGDVQVRRGSLFFTSDPPAAGSSAGEPDRRRFAVEFTVFFRGDRREDEQQIFAFDGQWLMEKRPQEKWFHLRQVVRPGEAFDPLKIGQGPFPLPIGQKKADILAEYDATLRPAADGLELENPEDAGDAEKRQSEMLIKDVAACWQVRLTPRLGAGKAPDFSEVRLWYMADKTGRLLPQMARTVAATDGPEIKGDIAIVRLINVKVNEAAEIKADIFDVQRPEHWDGQVDELPRPGAAPPKAGG